jgi:hypothetical protein
LVGAGFRFFGTAAFGTGSMSTNGVVGGLGGTGVGAHSTGSATVVVWAKTLDFFDVKIVGPKMVAAPVAAPILSTSLLVISGPFFRFLFLSFAPSIGIQISFHHP